MDKTLAILFLGGAKRVSMARFFKRAVIDLGMRPQLYSYEMDTHVPIAAEAKVIVGKRWSDPALYADLDRLVEKYGISLIVPFVDGAVSVAATMMDRHRGRVFAPTATAEQSEAMFDKVVAAKLFAKQQLAIPVTWCGGEIDKPLLAKPRRGSASMGLIKIDSAADLQGLSLDDYLVQERIDDREEYTVDCYVSVATGKPLAIVPRKRIEIVGGEVSRTETAIAPEVYDLANQALSRLGLRGAVTVQVLHDRRDNRYMIMEINPRLGGGAVCSVHAGADLPRLIVAESMGQQPEPVCYRPYTEIVRYPQEVAFFN